MKHWTPRIAEAADAAVGTGVDTIVGLVLAPHYSALSIAGYRDQLAQALDDRAELLFVDSWHDDPGFVDFLADRIRGTDASRRLHGPLAAGAHPRDGRSVPRSAARDLGAGRRGSRRDDWSFSFQSESPTGEPWLGPDILDHLQALHEAGTDRVLVCPVGFVSDHLEIRWDIDTEAQEKAAELGMEARAGSRCRTPTRASSTSSPRSSTTDSRRSMSPVAVEPVSTPGRIVVDRVSQRFRVSERPYRTLKDVVVARGRAATSEVVGARRCLARGRARRGARARRPQRLRQDDAAPADVRDLQADLGPRRRRRPGRRRCSSSARASIPTSRAARTSS